MALRYLKSLCHITESKVCKNLRRISIFAVENLKIKIMAWVAVQIQHYNMIPTEEEVMFQFKPTKDDNLPNFWFNSYGQYIVLPKGTIKKLIGRDLTCNDDPVELK